ncbi:hypothetical protein VP01_1042g3 [Puccinia sorghi]|uniref:Uncharacterized protein n=1 Tax=Puccinia sorghi TaxID=27349 RepID=A0A0L6VUB2_9BASI|nr:hypothetical protein VP01_1042g3 [Puccinia sorghi]
MLKAYQTLHQVTKDFYSPNIRLNFCKNYNQHTTGISSVCDQVKRKHLHVSSMETSLVSPLIIFKAPYFCLETRNSLVEFILLNYPYFVHYLSYYFYFNILHYVSLQRRLDSWKIRKWTNFSCLKKSINSNQVSAFKLLKGTEIFYESLKTLVGKVEARYFLHKSKDKNSFSISISKHSFTTIEILRLLNTGLQMRQIQRRAETVEESPDWHRKVKMWLGKKENKYRLDGEEKLVLRLDKLNKKQIHHRQEGALILHDQLRKSQEKAKIEKQRIDQREEIYFCSASPARIAELGTCYMPRLENFVSQPGIEQMLVPVIRLHSLLVEGRMLKSCNPQCLNNILAFVKINSLILLVQIPPKLIFLARCLKNALLTFKNKLCQEKTREEGEKWEERQRNSRLDEFHSLGTHVLKFMWLWNFLVHDETAPKNDIMLCRICLHANLPKRNSSAENLSPLQYTRNSYPNKIQLFHTKFSDKYFMVVSLSRVLVIPPFIPDIPQVPCSSEYHGNSTLIFISHSLIFKEPFCLIMSSLSRFCHVFYHPCMFCHFILFYSKLLDMQTTLIEGVTHPSVLKTAVAGCTFKKDLRQMGCRLNVSFLWEGPIYRPTTSQGGFGSKTEAVVVGCGLYSATCLSYRRLQGQSPTPKTKKTNPWGCRVKLGSHPGSCPENSGIPATATTEQHKQLHNKSKIKPKNHLQTIQKAPNSHKTPKSPPNPPKPIKKHHTKCGLTYMQVVYLMWFFWFISCLSKVYLIYFFWFISCLSPCFIKFSHVYLILLLLFTSLLPPCLSHPYIIVSHFLIHISLIVYSICLLLFIVVFIFFLSFCNSVLIRYLNVKLSLLNPFQPQR